MEINIAEILTAVGGILTALLVIGGIVVKLTKTKKDDEIFEKIEGSVKPVLETVAKPK